MAQVYFGSARIDENGNAHGGKAGDQTGNEVSIQPYYTHKKGWIVIRAISDQVREAIAQDMEWACANNNIGYDQWENQSLYKVVEPLKFNCSLVTVKCETDCARLVRVCVKYAGIPAPDFYTGNELTALLGTGAFVQVPFNNNPDILKRGDILVTKTKGHTVVALTSGDGSSNVVPIPEPNEGKYKVGWHQDSKGWWYADTINTYLQETWKVIDHHWYYFDDEGYMVTGWQTINGKIFYLQESNEDHYQGACWISDETGAQRLWYVD